MATHIFSAIRDENTDVHYGANVSKTKKKAGLGGLKPLSDITNSEKPSGVKALNKNTNISLKGLPNSKTKSAFLNSGYEGSVARQSNVLDTQKNRRALADISNSKKMSQNKVPDAQKKSGPSGRRALTDISNSKSLSTHQVIKKAFPKKLDDIAEEGFLHNHQGCVDTITRELDFQYYFSTFEFDDDFSAEVRTPVPLKSDLKADFSHSPRYMEYEDVPDLLMKLDINLQEGQLKIFYHLAQAIAHLLNLSWPRPNCCVLFRRGIYSQLYSRLLWESLYIARYRKLNN